MQLSFNGTVVVVVEFAKVKVEYFGWYHSSKGGGRSDVTL